MKAISTEKAPAAIGPYSQAIQVGNLVYTSGQIPIDPATGMIVTGGIKEQTLQSLTNVKAIFRAISRTFSCCRQDVAERSIGRNRSHSRGQSMIQN